VTPETLAPVAVAIVLMRRPFTLANIISARQRTGKVNRGDEPAREDIVADGNV
jgi:hypothetical protein